MPRDTSPRRAPRVLVDAIHSVAAGKRYLSHDVAQTLALGCARRGFSAAARRCLHANSRCSNCSYRAAALRRSRKQLSLNQKTVANHQSAIEEKLGAGSSGAAVPDRDATRPGPSGVVGSLPRREAHREADQVGPLRCRLEVAGVHRISRSPSPRSFRRRCCRHERTLRVARKSCPGGNRHASWRLHTNPRLAELRSSANT